ncbi:hypothetical protein BKI52_42335 [marine bacterium AO1-C]|nr:hypothetical protein BKI52_42335 [marine bacterium AO1-C]
MSEIHESKLPENLTALLKDQEKVEHLAQPTQESYENLFQKTIVSLLISLIAVNGFISYSINAWFIGFKDLPFATFVYYLIFNLFNISLASKAMGIKKSYPNSFYAYSNMRLFFMHPQNTKIEFIFFKDIHDLKIQGQDIVIDRNDTYNSASGNQHKRLQYIHGVQNPENFVKEIDQKLLRYRL